MEALFVCVLTSIWMRCDKCDDVRWQHNIQKPVATCPNCKNRFNVSGGMKHNRRDESNFKDWHVM
jgi:acetyl-CoA carboxylase beta subunit